MEAARQTLHCHRCNERRPRKGFRENLCERCFVAELATLPSACLAAALHEAFPDLRSSRLRNVMQILLDGHAQMPGPQTL